MSFQFFEPKTLGQAIALSSEWGEDGHLIAGGTDLVIQMRRRLVMPSAVISLAQLGDLRTLDINDEKVSIGALVTHRQIEAHPFFTGPYRGLAESARVIGGRQVRNVATVAGNICNASPAADMMPMLLALDADVHLAGAQAIRIEPLRTFIWGPRRTSRRMGEIMTAVSFARSSGRTATAFLKAGRRRAMEISIVSMAGVLESGTDGKPGRIRLAAGAVGPKAMRLSEAETVLNEGPWDEARIDEAVRCAVYATRPISDVRASAEYRRHLTGVYVRRILRLCKDRNGDVE